GSELDFSILNSFDGILPTQATPTIDTVSFSLTSLSVGALQYTQQSVVDTVALRRVDNPVTNDGSTTDSTVLERNIVFLIDGNTPAGLGITMQEEVLINMGTFDRGSDNLFVNNMVPNTNNIERVDFISTGGITAPATDLDKIGFVIFERGGNDAFKIAAITMIDSDPTMFSFGTVVSVVDTNFGMGTNIDTTVFNDTDGMMIFTSTDVPAQALSGVFISFQELGIGANQMFFGFALTAADVGTDFADFTMFPLDTSDMTAATSGGLDLVASGAIYVPITSSVTLVGPASFPEMNSTNNVTYTLSLASTIPNPTIVTFSLTNGTADNMDYTPFTQTITIPASTSTSTVTVTISGDTVPEADETFNVSIAAAQTTGTTSIQATIVNDDFPTVNLIPGTVSQSESNTAFVYTVSLSETAPTATTVTYQTQDGTANWWHRLT
ncbi:MAG: hypothetical protein CV045_13500, partial [Cyanobacteria bacterium M5B4]